MPRRIISQDPKVIPSVPAKNIDSVVMTQFRSRTDDSGKTQVRVVLTPQDNSTGQMAEEESYAINLKDFDQQVSQSPKLSDAWNTINDIMGLAYDFYRLKEKVIEGKDNGDDVTTLISARDAALDALRAPVV